MKLGYKFSNLLGTVYKKGNIIFSKTGDCLLSPVGNRVTLFDLKSNKSRTLGLENRKDISCICLSPDSSILIAVDDDGKSIVFSLKNDTPLHFFTFKYPVRNIKYSPNGRLIAVTLDRKVQVWHAPGANKEFAAFKLLHTHTGFYSDTTTIDWSDDSRFFVVGSEDMTARVFSITPMEGHHPFVVTGHRNCIISCFFEENSLNFYTVSKDGAVMHWECNKQLLEVKEKSRKRRLSNDEDKEEYDEDDKDEAKVIWRKKERHFFFQDNSELNCASYHKSSKILVAGFSTGVFMLYELPEFIQIHALSISQHRISSIAINSTGEWLAFGSSSFGQLLVWEWQSETYVLKQQGHFYDMNILAYSSDGQLIATGGDDGKVKVWNTISGFCFVTFHEHTASVTGVVFNQNNKVVLSSSLDGTIRAFDMTRYRNFRTFASPRPAQFSCLALDGSGEVVAAGSVNSFEIFVWSMQTGRLLEVLAGHEGPVSNLAFNPMKALLYSSSWDKTIKVWDIFTQRSAKETLPIGSDVLTVAVRPDGNEITVASLDGQLTFWQPDTAVQLGSIEGRGALGGGRRSTDKVSAKTMEAGKCFTTLCYSADGSCILAGGKSKFISIFHIEQQILLRKFEISKNRSLDGMQEMLNSRNMTEAGPLSLIEDDEHGRNVLSLPGVLKGDMSSRRVSPEIQTKCVKFSPTGRAWAAATTEGLLLYSLNPSMAFTPYDLEMETTVEKTLEFLSEKELGKAIVCSLRLNEDELVQRVIESVNPDDIQGICQSLGDEFSVRLLNHVAKQLETSNHLEFYLLWSKHLLFSSGKHLKENSLEHMPLFISLQKNLTRASENLGKLCDGNIYTLEYLLNMKQRLPVLHDERQTESLNDL